MLDVKLVMLVEAAGRKSTKQLTSYTPGDSEMLVMFASVAVVSETAEPDATVDVVRVLRSAAATPKYLVLVFSLIELVAAGGLEPPSLA